MDKVQSRLIPVPKWPNFHPWPSRAGLRKLIIERTKNGFDKVIVRAGRRILIDEDKFFEWVREQNQLQKESDAGMRRSTILRKKP